MGNFRRSVRQSEDITRALGELIFKWNAFTSRGFFGRMKWILFGR